MTDIKMMKAIGVESIHVTSSSSDMDAGDLLSVSINSGVIGGNVMSTSLMSSASFTSSVSQVATNNANDKPMISSTGGISITHGVSSSGSPARFPKLEECAHFHYERVQLGRIHIRLIDESKKNDCNSSLITETASCSTVTARTLAGENFIMKVSAGRSDPFLIRRSLENLKSFDSILHRCVYDRRVSELKDLNEFEARDDEHLEDTVSEYLARFSMIASDTITCGSILTWLQLDNKGRRLPVADRDTMLTINTPAVGAAYGVRKYIAQACDEISIDVGDMISVIDMPSPAESVWWRGKKSLAQKNQYEVGFFPQSCVATIGEKVPRNMPLPAPLVGSLALSPTKPVLRKHGKLISFFRSFILARPSRRRLKQSGIYKERVFSCDLSEHLLNSQQDIPMVLKHCAEFIENFGIVDGIYRLSGITSNIQKLRRAFDEERVPDLTTPEFRHDIHAVSSLLKMYFRELPNPLCTYQLYDHFVEAIQAKVENPEEKVRLIKTVVQKLPPPHYRTLKYLAMHLYKISRYGESTGMTERNIAIVWAPNLLRSPALEAGGVAALKGVGVQAVVTEYLISKCEDIFDDSYIPVDTTTASMFDDSQPASLNSVQSAIEIRDHDLFMPMERPKSLNVGGPKLITLEEAQIKQNRVSLESKALPTNPTGLPTGVTSYIEVGGGPASLPDKYHTVLPLPKNKRKSGNSIMALFCRPSKSTSTHNIQSSATVLTTTPENATATTTTIMKPSRPITLKKSTTVSSPTVAISAPVDMVTSSEDMLDAKTAELLLTKRSNSIDSLRTAGHSRSVSHDSYFDLLQSPLRGFVTMCPSREMSELVMNFDREEADMRIFSESESLVSSPRVAKENNRRTTKVRIDEQGNINPSPKKQPRLNIPNTNSFNGSHHLPVTTPETLEDDSYSNKKYKFEDQLNQLQYIDSNTPEHTVPVVNTGQNNESHSIFTSVQIHEEPRIEWREKTGVTKENGPFERYSYPYYEVVPRETSTNIGQNERFSLPPTTKMTVDYPSDVSVSGNSLNKLNQEKPSKILRHSYLEATSSANDILRHADGDVASSKSKLSVNTPQSEQQSPSYSLLVTSTTSSDNSSIIDAGGRNTTKVFDTRPSTLELTGNGIDQKIEGSISTTSQSLTPSDIAYSQMAHQQNVEVTPKSDSDNLEALQGVSDLGLEHAFSTYEYIRPGEGVAISPIKSGATTPVRATISITYNLKSPVKEMPKPEMGNDYEDVYVPQQTQNSEDNKAPGLLETSFDTTNVYEQVKFLKSAVNELNELIDEKATEAMETEQEVPDFAMHEPPQDSLECDNDENVIKSMYENVTQPKPPAFYENLDYKAEKIVNDGTLRESGYKEMEFKYEVPTKIEIRSGSDSSNKKSVRQLANKFETSPIEVLPPFDFTQKGKREGQNIPSPTTPNRMKVPMISKDLSPNITRSLDENAFVREFGSVRKSAVLAPVEIKGVLIENNNSSRRKSGDNLKPKMLNQPKKLPGLKQNDPEYCKQSVILNNNKKESGPPPVPPKITPTTENRISLIQQNFATQSSDDERSGHTSSLKMLGSCKLDRERIERIKEERRNQLQEKFRSESFRTEKDSSSPQKVKSKSRSDIRESVSEKPLSTSLRVKSKSRAELPTMTKVCVDGHEVQLRPPSSATAARQQQINSLKLDDTKDKRSSNNKTSTCDTNKQQNNEKRASRDSIGSVGRKRVDSGSGDVAAIKQDKFIMRPTDTSTNSSDRMSIKDVAAMFESKSHTNY